MNLLLSQAVLQLHVKDMTPTLERCDVIYHVKYERCDHGYVGETVTPLGPSNARLKEHQENTPYSR